MRNLFLIVLQFLLAATAQAQLQENQTTANVNLRESSNVNSNVLTVIPKGAHVTSYDNYSSNSDALLIAYKGKIGYVSSKYLKSYVPVREVYKSNSYEKPHSGEIKYYRNSNGDKVQSPTYYNSPPPGATALCRDGTYSFSKNRRGTCSHHGGVAKWLQ